MALKNASINHFSKLRFTTTSLCIPRKTQILLSPQSCKLITTFVTVSPNSAGLRPGPFTGSQNFFPLDLSYYQIKELLQLDFLPTVLECSENSFLFFFFYKLFLDE